MEVRQDQVLSRNLESMETEMLLLPPQTGLLGCRKSIIFHNRRTDRLPQDLTKTEIMKLYLNTTARLSCPLLLAKQQIKDIGETTNHLCVVIHCISAATFVKGEDFAEVALQYLKIITTPKKGCGDTTKTQQRCWEEMLRPLHRQLQDSKRSHLSVDGRYSQSDLPSIPAPDNAES